MESKKLSKAQLEKAVRTAIVYVPKTKETKTLRLDDRGFTITITENYTVVSTNFHRNVFSNFVSDGLSNPHVWLDSFIQICEKYHEYGEIKDDNGNVKAFSLKQMMENAKDKLEDVEFMILQHTDAWLSTLTEGCFAIGDTDLHIQDVMIMYLSFLAKSNVLLSAADKDIYKQEMYNKYLAAIRWMVLDSATGISLEEVEAIENEALEKLKNLAKEKGNEFADSIAIHKRAFEDQGALRQIANG